jgi:hypothetical protein
VADWGTIAGVGTAAGTLALAAATYSAVRSSNRSARIAERTLALGLRPVLVSSREDDRAESVTWQRAHHAHVQGGRAYIDDSDGVLYLAVTLRNVGAGLAVLQAWHLSSIPPSGRAEHPPMEDFRKQIRDIYIPAGDTGFWQAALRDPDDAVARDVRAANEANEPLSLYLLYGDHEGGQLTISLFGLVPADEGPPRAEIGRHWTLDSPDPHLRAE